MICMYPQQFLEIFLFYDTESIFSTSYQKRKENDCDISGMYLSLVHLY